MSQVASEPKPLPLVFVSLAHLASYEHMGAASERLGGRMHGCRFVRVTPQPT